MLKYLRKQKVAKKIFYLLVFVIIVGFVMWGSVSDIKSKGSKNYAGKIFGKKISYEQYYNALYAWRNQMIMQYGDKARQLENLFDPNQATWDRLILEYETKKRKIKVNDAEVSQYITSLTFLQKDGLFDQQLYELFLRYSVSTQPRVFEEQIRQTLKYQKLFEQITDDVTVTDAEVKEAYNNQHRQIKVRYLNTLSKDMENQTKLTEDDLKNYYDKQKQEFVIPIQINLNYLGFDYPKEPTDEQKKEIEQKAKDLQQFLKEGNDLAKAEEKFALKAKETGFFSLGQPLPDFEWVAQDFDKFFNLKENEFTDIIPTNRGPYVFQLKQKRLDYQQSFQEVKQTLKEKLTQQKAKELAKAKIDSIYVQIKSEKEKNADLDLSQVAKQLGVSTKETEFFAKYAAPKEMNLSPEFNEAAFKLKDKEISPVIETEEGCFVIGLSEEKPIDEKEFQNVKDKFKQNLLSEKKNQAFEEFFTLLKSRANLIDYVSKESEKQSSQLP